MKEIRKDLYTQTEYARKIGKSKARVNQLIKSGSVQIVEVQGTTLIKVV